MRACAGLWVTGRRGGQRGAFELLLAFHRWRYGFHGPAPAALGERTSERPVAGLGHGLNPRNPAAMHARRGDAAKLPAATFQSIKHTWIFCAAFLPLPVSERRALSTFPIHASHSHGSKKKARRYRRASIIHQGRPSQPASYTRRLRRVLTQIANFSRLSF